MDAEKLVTATKAEIVNGKALAWVDGKRLTLAQYVDGNLVLTGDGRALVEKLNEAAKPKPKPAPDAEADT